MVDSTDAGGTPARIPLSKKPSAYLVLGPDAYLVEQTADEIVRSVLPDYKKGDFGLEIVNGLVDRVDDALAALAAVRQAMLQTSFFAEDKVVWLRNVSFCGADRTSKSETVRDAVEAFRTELREKGLPEGVSLLVTGTAIAKNSALANTFKAMAKDGAARVDECAGGSADAALKILQKTLAAQRRTMGADAMRALVDRVGTDGLTLVSESEKLFAYTAGREPTVEDVLTICTFHGADVPWDFAAAFGSRDLPAARAALRNLLSQKVDAIFLLIVLENCLNEIALLVDARERGQLVGQAWSPALSDEDREAVRDLGKFDVLARPGFMKARIVAQANKWTRAPTVRARLAVMRAHENAVTVSLNPATLLELALAEALA